jgi:ERCC4-type nuclease
MYKLYIDCRERHLIELFEADVCDCTIKSLDIGDILITDENEKVYCIIERKSIKDLNASLKDGRYKEQKNRLINNFNKKHILYILEDYVSFESLDDKKLESAVIHSLFRDEIKFVFSRNLTDTYHIVNSIFDRVVKNPHYFEVSTESAGDVAQIEQKPYFNMTTIKKSSNDDVRSIQKHMFCQIPGISEQTATSLCDHYGGLYKMIVSFQDKTEDVISRELNTLKCNNRKISKRVVDNIIKYIIQD